MANPSQNAETYFRSAQNAGWNTYAERATSRFLAKEGDLCSRTVTVKSGQVLKALSFVKSDTAGKMVAGGNIAEYAKLVLSGTAEIADTVIMGGLTLTASAQMTAAELISAFLTQSTTKGTFTGTLTGWELVTDPNSTATLWAYSTTGLTNVTDFAVTGTAVDTAPTLTATVTTVAGSTTFQKPAGILAFDVDATSADVEATMYYEASVYADALVWGVNVASDTITKADGTTVACTAYNTGANNDLLKQMYVEGTEFEIVIPTTGEALQHG